MIGPPEGKALVARALVMRMRRPHLQKRHAFQRGDLDLRARPAPAVGDHRLHPHRGALAVHGCPAGRRLGARAHQRQQFVRHLGGVAKGKMRKLVGVGVISHGPNMARRFALVDVFAGGPLSGNPLAVVHEADGLDSEAMLRLTRWLNFSETAFLLTPDSPEADYRVRIFTPDRELPFAGHPTLGSAHAWLAAGGAPRRPGRLVQQCGVGLVPLRLADGLIGFSAPPLLRSGPVSHEDRAEVVAMLGIADGDVMAMAWADNGPGWIAVQLRDAAAVLALTPARSWVRRIDVGVIGAHPPGVDVAFEVRTFFTDQRLAVREDPVTGSFNAAAAQWLVQTRQAGGEWRAAQGQAIGHGGRIHLDAREDGLLWVSGACRTVAEGILPD